MNGHDQAQRVTAWTWAARTMGVECDEHRIAGLVEVTNVVPVDDLKSAISIVMRTEPNGFLPSPGAVIAAYRSASEQRARMRRAPGPSEMSREDHLRWMASNNPEGWDSRTWGGFVERMATDQRFKALVDANFKKRHLWAEEQSRFEIGQRRVDAGYRIDLRCQLNIEAIDKFPRPNPFDDGWIPSAEFDPISALARGMTA